MKNVKSTLVNVVILIAASLVYVWLEALFNLDLYYYWFGFMSALVFFMVIHNKS